MTSILKQPTKVNSGFVPKQENENETDSICSAYPSSGSSQQPIHPFSTRRAFSSQTSNAKAFPSLTTSANLSSQGVTNESMLHKDQLASTTSPVRPPVVNLKRSLATNERLGRSPATLSASVAPTLAKANFSPMLTRANVSPKLGKANMAPSVSPMIGKRFEPIISFAGSLFTADASPEVIDTVMVNEQESYGGKRSQDRMDGELKIEPKFVTTNDKKQDVFWCGICGNMYKSEETLMMHVKTHRLPPSWTSADKKLSECAATSSRTG